MFESVTFQVSKIYGVIVRLPNVTFHVSRIYG
ncbi:unnamed protein product, partial [marine sediment metagenome]